MTWGSIASCDWKLELQVSNFSHCREIFRTLCNKNLCGAKTDQSSWWFSIALVLFLALLTDSIICCLWQHYISRFILQKDCAVTRCLHCFSAPQNETYWSVVNHDGSAPKKISIFRWNYPDDLHLYVPSNLSQAAIIYPSQQLQSQAFIPSSPSLRVVTVKP